MGGAASQASSSETVFLCQIVLLLVSGRLLGEAMLRIGYPSQHPGPSYRYRIFATWCRGRHGLGARASVRSQYLYVAGRGRPSRRHRMAPSFNINWGGIGTNEEAILRDAVRLGDRFGVPLRTAVRAHADPGEAILRQLTAGEHNLIVMGVSPRPGTTLFFGDAAAVVLRRSDRSILLVAS
jgi:nucleotide-binding universal stress UspA family protein